jgi:plasmid stabilization system protein ParE
MKFTIQYTQRADNDIFEQVDWWARNYSPEQAVSWEAVVRQQIDSLITLPERHAFAPETSKFPFDVRQMLVGPGPRPSFRAVYTVRDSTVVVLTIQSGARDDLRLADLM